MNEKATPRILVVEDDEVIAALTTGMLGDSGEIAWAASAEHALELLAESDFDLLVVDIGLPGISGLDLIRKVKDRDPLLATLILTGEASDDVPLAAMYAGIRTLRLADGPDEVHRRQVAKRELARYLPVDLPVDGGRI